jgi:hypothetical protein
MMGMNSMVGDLTERYDELYKELTELNSNLSLLRSDTLHSRQLREWERFAMIDGGLTSGTGGLTVGGGNTNLRPCPNGWEAYITSVAVTISGASHAATMASYNGESDDQNLFDYASAFVGDTPSRLVAFYHLETIYVEQGDPVTFVIAGAVASQRVVVRVCGKRRMT